MYIKNCDDFEFPIMQISYNIMVCEFTEGCGQNIDKLEIVCVNHRNALGSDTKQCKNMKNEEAHFFVYYAHTYEHFVYKWGYYQKTQVNL